VQLTQTHFNKEKVNERKNGKKENVVDINSKIRKTPVENGSSSQSMN